MTRFAERAGQLRWKSRKLPVPCAFHTPLLRPSQGPLEKALADREVRSPTIPFISGTTASFLSDPEELRAALVKQMASPVRFAETVRKLRNAGAEILIEAGPGHILTTLSRPHSVRRAAALVHVIGSPQSRWIGAIHPAAGRIGSRWSHRTVGGEPAPVTRQRTFAEPAAAEPTIVKSPSQASPLPEPQPVSQGATAIPTAAIPVFDATQRRRERQRLAAISGSGAAPATRPVERKPAQPPDGGLPAPATVSTNASAGNGASVHRANGEHGNPDLVAWLVKLVRDQSRLPLESISEQTTWREAVASPGKLLAELSEYFELSPMELSDLGLSRSVSDLANLLTPKAGKGAWLSPSRAPSATIGSGAANVPAIRLQPQPAGTPRIDAGSDLESFLIGFIVDQTGYPAEMVELDADLEADLGIDSIKKAQLFGELGERFQLTADPNLSLDDFPTLRLVLSYLEQQGIAPQANVRRPSNRPAAPATVKSLAPAQETVTLAPGKASTTAVLECRQNRRQLPIWRPSLVDFVVEQTGYPLEMVELAADLEADLGIDSIKKAQLFGELGERFQISADPDLSLDDFPTLQHVLSYLETRLVGGARRPASLSPCRSRHQQPRHRSTRAYCMAGHGRRR